MEHLFQFLFQLIFIHTSKIPGDLESIPIREYSTAGLRHSPGRLEMQPQNLRQRTSAPYMSTQKYWVNRMPFLPLVSL